MDLLPLEILAHICSSLDRQSLASFSITNKRNRAASKSVLFQDLHIKFPTGDDAVQAVCNHWQAFLQDVNSAQHVRRLEIVTSPSPLENPGLRDAGDDSIDNALALERHDSERRVDFTPVEEDAMVGLIVSLRGLRHLAWECPWRLIPSSVLELLESRNCRLDMRWFQLHSLRRRSEQSVEIDEYDLRLATSPCLESIDLGYADREGAFENYNHDALLDMIAGAAPNLRHVTMRRGRYFWTAEGNLDPYHRTAPRKPWRGDLFPFKRSSRAGTLTSLDLRRGSILSELLVLSIRTDFSVLRSIHIDVDVEVIRWITGLTRALCMLNICLCYSNETERAAMWAAAPVFFSSLPPLTCLTLKGGWNYDILEGILERHGKTLLRILLPGGIKPVATELLVRHCSVLEELSLTIQRTQGDAREVSTYKALGELPVRDLTLSLIQTDPEREYEDIIPDDMDMPWTNFKLKDILSVNEIRNLLINFAVDETLAKDIFSIIALRKAELGLPPLENLQLLAERVRTNFTAFPDPAALLLPMAHLSHSWSCVRNPRDDSASNDCWVKELPLHDGRLREWLVGINYPEDGSSGEPIFATVDPWMESIIRSIWPGTGPWQDVCHSLPLAKGTEQPHVSTELVTIET